MKNKFSLETHTSNYPQSLEVTKSKILIVKNSESPFVAIRIKGLDEFFIQNKDLKKFAFNILKTIKKAKKAKKTFTKNRRAHWA